MPSEVPIEVRQEISKFRQVMYEPSAVWLSTEYSGDRWLTDQYVLLNVTDSPALGYHLDPDDDCAGGDCNCMLEDGPYKLLASGELRSRDSIPEPDIEAYFAAVAGEAQWRNAAPTEWSVAEHPGKAMLWTCRDFPALLGEPTWTQIKRHYPEVVTEYTFTHNMFRFSKPEHDHPSDDMCELGGCPLIPFCFAAGIRVPYGQESVAAAIAEKIAA